MPELVRDGEVFLLRLGDGENRINNTFIDEMSRILDEVEWRSGPSALVTCATVKFFSNGLDLDWIGVDADRLEATIKGTEVLLRRLLCLPCPTIAALQGHTFAAGAMLALAHDHRIMCSDRGFFCLAEVDIDMAFRPGMAALITAKLSPPTARDAMLTGRRYGGDEAVAGGIADAAVPESDLLTNATDRARGLAPKAGAALRTVRSTMYPAALSLLTTQ